MEFPYLITKLLTGTSSMVMVAGQPGSGKTYTMKGYQFSVTETVDLRKAPKRHVFPASGSTSSEFIKSAAFENRIGITMKCLKEVFN